MFRTYITLITALSATCLLLLALCLSNCTQKNQESSTAKPQFTSNKKVEIPKLLDRAEALRNGKKAY